MTIRPAAPDDVPAIAALLSHSSLPSDGIRSRIDTTLVAVASNVIVGTAALEVFPDGALLRSVVVADGRRTAGVGRELVHAALSMAMRRGISEVYLLTTTAEHYFPRFGFKRIGRELVPDSVRQSGEFTVGCPASAAVMRAMPSAS